MQGRHPGQTDAFLDHASFDRVNLRAALPREECGHATKTLTVSTTDPGNRVGPRSCYRGQLCPRHKPDPASSAGSRYSRPFFAPETATARTPAATPAAPAAGRRTGPAAAGPATARTARASLLPGQNGRVTRPNRVARLRRRPGQGAEAQTSPGLCPEESNRVELHNCQGATPEYSYTRAERPVGCSSER